MLRRSLTILIILIVSLQEAGAQYDPSFSHYWAMETAYNPAAAGKQDKLNIVAAYNMSMVGFEHNPHTIFATADMPFYFAGTYHGMGVQLVNDDIGVFSHKKFSVIYALRQKLLGGTLGIGVMPGFLSETMYGSKLDLGEPDDDAFPTTDVTGTAFDLSAGLYYQHKWWYLGAAVQHALAPKVELGETNELDVDRVYYLMAGYNIRLKNPFLSIQPSVMGRSDGVGYRADVTTRLTYSHDGKVMYAGVGYSPTNSVTVYLGGSFHGIILGYSYEMYTTAVSIGNGSHELFVGYQTDINLFKKGRNRHQSVRIL